MADEDRPEPGANDNSKVRIVRLPYPVATIASVLWDNERYKMPWDDDPKPK